MAVNLQKASLSQMMIYSRPLSIHSRLVHGPSPQKETKLTAGPEVPNLKYCSVGNILHKLIHLSDYLIPYNT